MSAARSCSSRRPSIRWSSAQCLRRRSDARRPRGRTTAGSAGKPTSRRRRNVEGSDRKRKFDGEQPDRPGAQHRPKGLDRIANGDLSRKSPSTVSGEICSSKTPSHDGRTSSTGLAASDALAREVGTEGKLGGQAQVKGVAGTWKDLTDSVQLHGRQPTDQVRQHRRGRPAVARGDLSKKITSTSAARSCN